MQGHEYVVLDIETTGLSRHEHRITEIAAVKFRNRAKIEEFHTLINPEMHIPRFITQLTGINDELVRDAPTIDNVMPKFLDFLGGATIVAHNSTFDYGFLNENAVRCLGVELENEKICTRRLAYRLLPDLPSRRLGCVCEHLGVNNIQAHRAMGDTLATAEVFSRFMSMLGQYNLDKKEEIIRFQSMPAAKCRELLLKRE